MLGIIAGMVIYLSFLSLFSSKPLLNPKGASLAPVQAMEPTSEDCDTPLCYIRLKGQELGYDDYTISMFIRIARAESGFNLNQYAKNPYSTAKGIYQFIDSTWRANCLEMGNVYDYETNIDCFFKVYADQGTQPWISSRSKWE